METVLTTDAAKFLEIAESLPIEMRIAIVDRLLESIQPTKEEIDRLWIAEVEQRVEQVENGDVEMVPGEEVFRKVREKYGV